MLHQCVSEKLQQQKLAIFDILVVINEVNINFCVSYVTIWRAYNKDVADRPRSDWLVRSAELT